MRLSSVHKSKFLMDKIIVVENNLKKMVAPNY